MPHVGVVWLFFCQALYNTLEHILIVSVSEAFFIQVVKPWFFLVRESVTDSIFLYVLDTTYQDQRSPREGSEREEAKEERTTWSSTSQGAQVFNTRTGSRSSLHMNTF
jgi:hypothetical protein